MAKPKSKSANPAFPDAPSTAPGGMSQKALIAELVTKHGWSEADAKVMKWPEQINAVIEERRQREREATAEYEETGHEELRNDLDIMADPDIEAMFDDPIEDDDDLDPDALMAELAAANSEMNHAAEPASGHSLLIKDPHGTGTLDYLFDGHFGAGPSASERWMHCTASLGASLAFLETLTPNQQRVFAESNMAARQGTTAHSAAEAEARLILGQIEQSEVDATLLELAVEPETGEEYTDEMAEYITEYVDLVKTYAQERGDDHVMIEVRVSAAVPLTGMHEGEVHEITGSGDCIVLPTPDEPTLVVSDLKYGEGIDVDVDENPQARIYALGALGPLVDDEGNLVVDVETVVYHIVQPRLGGIKTWSEPLSDLLQWRDEVLAPTLTAALFGVDYGATFAPSENACQFCPARGSCPSLAEQRVAQAAELFDVVVEAEYADGPGAFPETTTLSDARLGQLLSQIEGLADIRKDLKAEVERRLFRGGAVPGWQLVNYSPPRKWKDEAQDKIAQGEIKLSSEQRDALFTEPALVSPTAAEKLLGKDTYPIIEPLVNKPDKRPVVAPVGDRRKTWEGRPPEAMFDIEEEA